MDGRDKNTQTLMNLERVRTIIGGEQVRFSGRGKGLKNRA